MRSFIGFHPLRFFLLFLIVGCILNAMIAALVSVRDKAKLSQPATAEPPAKPATIAEAVGVLDLMTFPTMNGPNEPVNRHVNHLSYPLPGDFKFKPILEFQRKAFTDRNWTELPGGHLVDEYAGDCTFTRDGFFASVTVRRGKGSWWKVSITLHGDVDVRRLPVPADFKPQKFQIQPQWMIYVTDVNVAQTTSECRKRFMDEGWQPYGVVAIDPTVSNFLYFKQNAILLVADISPSWAKGQARKTRVSIHTGVLPVDLPVPAETMRLRYYDGRQSGSQLPNLYFETQESQDEIARFYRQSLESTGWKASTDNTVKVGIKDVLIFRNLANDMLTLEMSLIEEDQVLRVTLTHETSVEITAIEKRRAEQAAKKNE